MSLPSLPLISLSPFLEHFASHTPDAASLQPYLSKLATACQHTGFFYLTDHGIPPARLHQVLQLARTFFLSASDAEKNKLARKRPDDARGYQRLGENVTLGRRDAHEAVDFYCETPPPLRDDNDDDNNNGNNGRADGLLSGSNMWPATPTELESEMRFYVKQVLSVGAAVVRAMGMALGEEDVFVRDTADSYWVMRLIGYPPLAEGAEGISCGEHTDYGCVTLLLADSTTGALQVKAKDGTWITANPIDGAFVVNIGDMMERWTNGLWKSTLHRVIHKGSNYRVSVPFFFEPNFEAVIKPLEACVENTGGEARFESVKYGDHLIGKIKGNFY